MKHLLLFSLLVVGYARLQAGVITGKVKDENGVGIPFATIYVQGTNKGTNANEKGYYHLNLPPGNYDIIYSCAGFQDHVEQIGVGNILLVVNVTLEAEVVKLNEVVVRARGDSAYSIVRKAIKVRDKHYRDVHDYSCEAYVKGVQKIIKKPIKVLGVPIKTQGTADTTGDNIFYLSESVSDFTLRKPDDVKEVMISSKVSGKSQSFSYNRVADLVQMDFYKNNFIIPQISADPFVTPLAYNAMIYYKYHLASTFMENGKKIYKIRCQPRVAPGPAFDGYIYLVDKTWDLYEVDLMLTKKHSFLTYVDTLSIHYSYTLVDDSLSVPLSQRFDFNFGFLGDKATGYVIAIYSDYKVNIPIPPHTFSDQVLAISDSSNEQTAAYWDSIRPIPLTDEELRDYAIKDSVEKKMESKSYLDSMDRRENRPASLSFLLGYNYHISYRKITIRFFAPIFTVQYNTVEGWNLRLQAAITRKLLQGKELVFTPSFRYGFSDTRFEGTLKVAYLYNPFLKAGFDAEGGRYVYQFNNGDPISELINSFNTLFLDENYMKLYEDRFFRVHHQIEPVNGLTINAGINISDRYLMHNTSAERAIKIKGKEFTANDSINSGLIPFDNLETTDPSRNDQRIDAIIYNMSVTYWPNQKYITRPDGKISLNSKWPQFTVSYAQALPGIAGSQMNYNYLGALIQQKLNVGIAGKSEYAFSAGVFPNHDFVGFMDYHHFNDNQTYFGLHYFIGFQLLDYYSASTDKAFIEAHYEHHFNGLILNRISKLSKLRWQLVVGAHYLYTPDFKSYGEFDIGVENILQAFRVDFVQSLSEKEHYQWGAKVGINFKEL